MNTKPSLRSPSEIQDLTRQQNRENEELRLELIKAKNQLTTLKEMIEELKKGLI